MSCRCIGFEDVIIVLFAGIIFGFKSALVDSYLAARFMFAVFVRIQQKTAHGSIMRTSCSFLRKFRGMIRALWPANWAQDGPRGTNSQVISCYLYVTGLGAFGYPFVLQR